MPWIKIEVNAEPTSKTHGGMPVISMIVALILFVFGHPKKNVRQQDHRVVPAYVTLLLIALILAVLHATGTSYVLTDAMQNIMNSLVEKVGG